MLKLVEHNVMLDIETLSTNKTAVILSIGAVLFNSSGIIGEFKRNILPNDCTRYGLTTDIDTIMWWLDQDKAAIQGVKENAVLLQTALGEFATFITRGIPHNSLVIWGNAPSFDCDILRNAYFQHPEFSSAPWEFWQEHCYRTINKLAKGVHSPKNNCKHDSLEDAKYQALRLINILGENNE